MPNIKVVLRFLCRYSNARMSAHCRFCIAITRRLYRPDRILRGIFPFAPMRNQICARSVIVSVLAKSVFKSFPNRKNSVRFREHQTILVIAQSVAAPKIGDSIRKSFSQIPVIDFPHGDAACRKSRIKRRNIHNDSAQFLSVFDALPFFVANAVFKCRV